MIDALGVIINSGDIVAYCGRSKDGTRNQAIRFGVVLNTDFNFGEGKRLKIIAVDEKLATHNLFEAKQPSYCTAGQVWVIKDRRILPPMMVRVLERTYQEYKQKEDEENIRINPSKSGYPDPEIMAKIRLDLSSI